MNRKVIITKIQDIEFPNIGIGVEEGSTIKIKGALLGQRVSARVKRRRNNVLDCVLLEVLEKADYEIESNCLHQDVCGGCTFQIMTYEKQLELKEKMVLSLFKSNGIELGHYMGIYGSPEVFYYRNKMEFSFGDTGKDGELSLGMRKKHSFYEVVFVSNCMLVDDDYRLILMKTVDFFRLRGYKFYNNRQHTGVLRHLVVRKSKAFGNILVNLVTAKDIGNKTLEDYKDLLLELNTLGNVSGILHSVNDGLADTVKLDDVRILYGKDYFYEQILGLTFKITPQSFFQTNTAGAELLYGKVLELAGDCGLVYDLYCGTGTITQIMAKRSKMAVGVEIVPEAVECAIENAKTNGIKNVEFICGDVLKIIDTLSQKPDLIVLDPPRDGVHPKAVKKIIELLADKIIYISCKATSLVRDLKMFTESGYIVENSIIVDLFAGCAHVETVVLISRVKN